jgi:hypothetical protein
MTKVGNGDPWTNTASSLDAVAHSGDDSDPAITPIIAKEKYLMLPLQFIQKAFNYTIECQPDGRFIKVFINK